MKMSETTMTEEEFREKVRDELRQKLIPQAISIPDDYEEEVYCDEKGEISFSAPMTSRQYTMSSDKIGRVASFSVNDAIELSDYVLERVDDSHYAYRYEADYFDSADVEYGVYDEARKQWVVSLSSVAKNWDLEDGEYFSDLIDEMTENAVRLYYPEAKNDE